MLIKKEETTDEYVEYDLQSDQNIVKEENINFTSEELLQENDDFEEETMFEKFRRLLKPIKCVCFIINCRDVSLTLDDCLKTNKKIIFGEAVISDDQISKVNAFTHIMSSLVRMRMPELQNSFSLLVSDFLNDSQGNFEMMMLSLNFYVASNISCKACKQSWDFKSIGKNVRESNQNRRQGYVVKRKRKDPEDKLDIPSPSTKMHISNANMTRQLSQKAPYFKVQDKIQNISIFHNLDRETLLSDITFALNDESFKYCLRRSNVFDIFFNSCEMIFLSVTTSSNHESHNWPQGPFLWDEVSSKEKDFVLLNIYEMINCSKEVNFMNRRQMYERLYTFFK